MPHATTCSTENDPAWIAERKLHKERLAFENPKSQHFNSEPTDVDEIKYNIIHSRKNNKAPGENTIVAELLKEMDLSLPQVMGHLFKRIWDAEEIPDERKCALIHPLHKKGDRTNANNYWGVTLLPIAYKILSKQLLQITEQVL